MKKIMILVTVVILLLVVFGPNPINYQNGSEVASMGKWQIVILTAIVVVFTCGLLWLTKRSTWKLDKYDTEDMKRQNKE